MMYYYGFCPNTLQEYIHRHTLVAVVGFVPRSITEFSLVSNNSIDNYGISLYIY